MDLDRQRIQAGDEIKIRMLGPGPVTPPTDRKPIGTYQKQKASAGFGTPSCLDQR